MKRGRKWKSRFLPCASTILGHSTREYSASIASTFSLSENSLACSSPSLAWLFFVLGRSYGSVIPTDCLNRRGPSTQWGQDET
ncbi:hypothetical protein BDV32DRAFT_16847 [Aspergillus pseudonomiae]|nr:hypothetical protein BDV32DRAFT_16847 [Aspergillus pseudonomiae]